MSISEILNIVFVVLTIVVGFVATYFKANSKLFAKVTAFISEAETTYKDTKTGGEKFQLVIGKLYALIPAAVRPFIPKSIVSALVQNVFDQIAAYATQQLDKATGTTAPTITQVTEAKAQ